MTATGEPRSALQPEGQAVDGPSRIDAPLAVAEVCPFLAAEDRAWRNAWPSRDHQCHAVAPAVLLATAKQRQLCLHAAHQTCATYVAARALAPEPLVRARTPGSVDLWPATPSLPVVLERGPRSGRHAPSGFAGVQGVLVGLMVLAVLVLVVARTQLPAASTPPGGSSEAAVVGALSSEAPLAAVSTPAPTPVATTVPPSATPGATPSPAPSPTPPSTVDSTPAPVATAQPAATTVATRRYRVKPGDTLGEIASRYGTSVTVLVELNGIADPRLIKIGEVLLIP